MQENELLRKWIEGTLTEDEKASFESSKAYLSAQKIINQSRAFKAPAYDVERELSRLKDQKDQVRNTRSISWLTTAWRVAAAIVVGVGLYYWVTFDNSTVTISTAKGEKIEYTLPDGSTVHLNAESSLSYNQNNWESERNISLNGEAFFKVQKGSTFSVSSTQGKVTVLGTQFNVTDRPELFEVTCYEGKVRVQYGENAFELIRDQAVGNSSGGVQTLEGKLESLPEWIRGMSSFRETPLQVVFAELERQYDIKVLSNDIQLNERFSGSFPHDNIDLALEAIATPLSLKYVKENGVIKFTSAK